MARTVSSEITVRAIRPGDVEAVIQTTTSGQIGAFIAEPIQGLGYVAPSTRRDLGGLATDLSSTNFAASFRLLGRTQLRMEPIRK